MLFYTPMDVVREDMDMYNDQYHIDRYARYESYLDDSFDAEYNSFIEDCQRINNRMYHVISESANSKAAIMQAIHESEGNIIVRFFKFIGNAIASIVKGIIGIFSGGSSSSSSSSSSSKKIVNDANVATADAVKEIRRNLNQPTSNIATTSSSKSGSSNSDQEYLSIEEYNKIISERMNISVYYPELNTSLFDPSSIDVLSDMIRDFGEFNKSMEEIIIRLDERLKADQGKYSWDKEFDKLKIDDIISNVRPQYMKNAVYDMIHKEDTTDYLNHSDNGFFETNYESIFKKPYEQKKSYAESNEVKFGNPLYYNFRQEIDKQSVNMKNVMSIYDEFGSTYKKTSGNFEVVHSELDKCYDNITNIIDNYSKRTNKLNVEQKKFTRTVESIYGKMKDIEIASNSVLSNASTTDESGNKHTYMSFNLIYYHIAYESMRTIKYYANILKFLKYYGMDEYQRYYANIIVDLKTYSNNLRRVSNPKSEYERYADRIPKQFGEKRMLYRSSDMRTEAEKRYKEYLNSSTEVIPESAYISTSDFRFLAPSFV